MDLGAGELRERGRKIKLQCQPFRILESLAQNSGKIVLREELYGHLSEHNLYDCKHGLDNAIERIRKALCDSAKSPRFVETIRGRGYRFLPIVELIPGLLSNGNPASPSTVDPFLLEIKRIREDFLGTDTAQGLGELYYRLLGFIHQNREHSGQSEALVLLDSIQAARSEHNVRKHGLGFEAAALVFEDPSALSIGDGGAKNLTIWHTLGRLSSSAGLLRRSAIVVVTHNTVLNECGWPANSVITARKATSQERGVYEKKQKKSD
ncbi:MAG: winged helix-turn-helix domain-containing protein [Acidobacteriia bacterium]|nr:winged helix-turn-helix domain-containing protein [Terriglobia bacterium]